VEFVAYDIETTGIDAERDAVIELAAVLFVDGRPAGEFSELIDPGVPIPEEARRVHGISDDDVRGKPALSEVLAPFAGFCGSRTLVAHNASFDFRFLARAVEQQRVPAPRGTVLDTCALARVVLPGLPNYRLSTLVQHLPIPASRFHRATEDAFYCGHLLLHLVGQLRKRCEPCDVGSLVKLSGKPAYTFPQFDQLDLF
jgi:DNA polymerase-3 subunit epsilon